MPSDNIAQGVRLQAPQGDVADDLGRAFDRFNSSLQTLTLQRTLNGANDQVAAIRNSEASEADKTNQLRDVASSLTFNLAGSGMDPARIEHLTNAFSPKAPLIQSPVEAAVYGTDAQKSAMRDQQRFSTNEAIRLDAAKNAGTANQGPDIQTQKFAEEQSQHKIADLRELNKEAEPLLASSRKPLGMMAVAQTGLAKFQTLLDDPSKFTTYGLHEAGRMVPLLLTGQSTTEQAADDLTPKSWQADYNKLKTYGTGKIDKLDMPDALNFFQGMKGRLEGVNNMLMQESSKKVLGENISVLQKYPDEFNASVGQMSKLPDGTPDSARIEKGASGKPEVRFVSDDMQDALKANIEMAAKRLQKNAADTVARNALEALKEDPYYPAVMHKNPKLAGQMRAAYGSMRAVNVGQ